MDLSELRAEAQRLQSAEPSRVIRGFDERETRTLLGGAAKLLETAAAQQEELERELEELRAKVGEEGAGKEAIGQALLAATRASEEMAAEARSSAERTKAEAEARAAAVLDAAAKTAEEREREHAAIRSELERERKQLAEAQESLRDAHARERERALKEAQAQAQAQADTIVADARREVARLEDYAEQLRSLLVEGQRSFVELAEAALHRVESVLSERPGSGSEELLNALRLSEPAEKPAPSGIAGD